MNFVHAYGAFVARATLTNAKARALAGAGHRVVVLQVDFQGSTLSQRTVPQLQLETDRATDAGLEVWWWAWCRPGDKRKPGRLSGPDALAHRLAELVAALGPPRGFIANCEVGGGWSPSTPDLGPIAAAARTAAPVIGLTSHGIVGERWPVGAFDIGLPQLYRAAHLTRSWASMCLRTWQACPILWPTLGAADSASDAAAMRADLAACEKLGARGALWWTARSLSGAKMAASVLSEKS